MKRFGYRVDGRNRKLNKSACKHSKKYPILFGGYYCPSCKKNVQ